MSARVLAQAKSMCCSPLPRTQSVGFHSCALATTSAFVRVLLGRSLMTTRVGPGSAADPEAPVFATLLPCPESSACAVGGAGGVSARDAAKRAQRTSANSAHSCLCLRFQLLCCLCDAASRKHIFAICRKRTELAQLAREVRKGSPPHGTVTRSYMWRAGTGPFQRLRPRKPLTYARCT